jgi:hypothetical protein
MPANPVLVHHAPPQATAELRKLLGTRTADETSHFKVYLLYQLRCALQPDFADAIRQDPDTWRRWGW